MNAHFIFLGALMLPFFSLGAANNNNAASTQCNLYGKVAEPLRDPNATKVIEYARRYIKENRNLFPGTLKRVFFQDQCILQARYEELVQAGFLRPGQVALNHMEFTAYATTEDQQAFWNAPLNQLIQAIACYDQELTTEKEAGGNEGIWSHKTYIWTKHENKFEQTVVLSKTRQANAGYFDREQEGQNYLAWKAQQKLDVQNVFEE